jgi:hypothetical protein
MYGLNTQEDDMEQTYAQVENGIVINVVVATAEWIAQQPGTWILYTTENPCAIGWTVTNGVCDIPPPPPED